MSITTPSITISDIFHVSMNISEAYSRLTISDSSDEVSPSTRVIASLANRVLGIGICFVTACELALLSPVRKIWKSINIIPQNQWSPQSIGKAAASISVTLYSTALKIATSAIHLLIPEISGILLGLKSHLLTTYFLSKALLTRNERINALSISEFFQLIGNCVALTNRLNYCSIKEEDSEDLYNYELRALPLRQIFNIALDSFPLFPTEDRIQRLTAILDINSRRDELQGEREEVLEIDDEQNLQPVEETHQLRADRIILPRNGFHGAATCTFTRLLGEINQEFIDKGYYTTDDIQSFGFKSNAFAAVQNQAVLKAIHSHFSENGEWSDEDKQATIRMPNENSNEIAINQYPRNFAFGSPKCLDDMRKIKNALTHFLSFTTLNNPHNADAPFKCSSDELFEYLLLYVMHDQEQETIKNALESHRLHEALTTSNQGAKDALQAVDNLITNFSTEYIGRGLLNQGGVWDKRDDELIQSAFFL